MDENSKTLILVLLGLFVVLFGFIGISNFMYPAGFEVLGITPESSYEYDVTISATEPVYNVKMFIPLPGKEGSSPIGFRILGGEGYGIPENMEAAIFGEGDSLFLKIALPEMEKLNFGISLDEVEQVDTQNPVVGSFIISPVKDLKSSESSDDYTTYIYASYESSPSAVVDIKITESGKNSWKSLSEKENSFDGTLTLSLTESPDKWCPADVHINKNIGDYTILF